MKIEKITENKIRIILNFEEIEENNIDFLSITQNTEFAKKVLKKILNKVEKEIDFKFEDSKLLIEAYVSIDGFFIITFTRLEEKKVKIKAKKMTKKKNYIYKFENFNDFCDLCTYLNNININYLILNNRNISLYEYEKKYYMIISSCSKEEIYYFNNMVIEFAKSINYTLGLDSKIKESGKIIIKKEALEKGIKYFCNKMKENN